MKIKIPKCKLCGTDWFDNFLDGDKEEFEADINSIEETGKCLSYLEEFNDYADRSF